MYGFSVHCVTINNVADLSGPYKLPLTLFCISSLKMEGIVLLRYRIVLLLFIVNFKIHTLYFSLLQESKLLFKNFGPL